MSVGAVRRRKGDGCEASTNARTHHCGLRRISLAFTDPPPTHGEQPGGNVVQANPPFAGIPAAWSGNINKILRPLPDAKMAPNIPKDTIPADVSASLPETLIAATPYRSADSLLTTDLQTLFELWGGYE